VEKGGNGTSGGV
jgi:hypothetical protein